MEILLIVLSYLLAIIGILAVIYPIIPGALVSYGSILLFYFATTDKMSVLFLIVWGVIVAAVSIIDSVLPPIITRRMGGSKKATTGSLLGVIIGSFFFPPFGMLIGAFAGALLGEWSETRRLDHRSMRVAIGSFFGFIMGTGLKLMVSITILITLIIKTI